MLIKKYVLNTRVCLLTRLYGIMSRLLFSPDQVYIEKPWHCAPSFLSVLLVLTAHEYHLVQVLYTTAESFQEHNECVHSTILPHPVWKH